MPGQESQWESYLSEDGSEWYIYAHEDGVIDPDTMIGRVVGMYKTGPPATSIMKGGCCG